MGQKKRLRLSPNDSNDADPSMSKPSKQSKIDHFYFQHSSQENLSFTVPVRNNYEVLSLADDMDMAPLNSPKDLTQPETVMALPLSSNGPLDKNDNNNADVLSSLTNKDGTLKEANSVINSSTLLELLAKEAILISQTFGLLLSKITEVDGKLDKLNENHEPSDLPSSRPPVVYAGDKRCNPLQCSWDGNEPGSMSLILQKHQVVVYLGESALNNNKWSNMWNIKQSVCELLGHPAAGIQLTAYERLPRLDRTNRIVLSFKSSRLPDQLLKNNDFYYNQYNIRFSRVFKNLAPWRIDNFSNKLSSPQVQSKPCWCFARDMMTTEIIKDWKMLEKTMWEIVSKIQGMAEGLSPVIGTLKSSQRTTSIIDLEVESDVMETNLCPPESLTPPHKIHLELPDRDQVKDDSFNQGDASSQVEHFSKKSDSIIASTSLGGIKAGQSTIPESSIDLDLRSARVLQFTHPPHGVEKTWAEELKELESTTIPHTPTPQKDYTSVTDPREVLDTHSPSLPPLLNVETEILDGFMMLPSLEQEGIVNRMGQVKDQMQQLMTTQRDLKEGEPSGLDSSTAALESSSISPEATQPTLPIENKSNELLSNSHKIQPPHYAVGNSLDSDISVVAPPVPSNTVHCVDRAPYESATLGSAAAAN